jgi:hypothetical protein
MGATSYSLRRPLFEARGLSPPRRCGRRRRSRPVDATSGVAYPQTPRRRPAVPSPHPRASTCPAAKAAAPRRSQVSGPASRLGRCGGGLRRCGGALAALCRRDRALESCCVEAPAACCCFAFPSEATSEVSATQPLCLLPGSVTCTQPGWRDTTRSSLPSGKANKMRENCDGLERMPAGEPNTLTQPLWPFACRLWFSGCAASVPAALCSFGAATGSTSFSYTHPVCARIGDLQRRGLGLLWC